MPIPQTDGFVPPIDEDPAEYQVGSFEIPTDPDWMATFLGALRPIIERENWDTVNADEVLADMDKIIATAERIYYSIQMTGDYMTCADVADCIETNETTQEAIANAINQNTTIQQSINRQVSQSLTQMGFDPTTSLVGTDTLTGEIKELDDCNQDKLWAGIRDGIVQRLDDNSRQFLEIMVTKADQLERANAVIGAIPVVGSMAQAILDQLVEIIPDLLNAYESYSSIDTLDEAACGIFEALCGECRYPTAQELYEYFANFGDAGLTDIASLTAETAYSILSGLATGSGFFVFHSFIAVQLYTLLLNEKFADYAGIASVETMASLGEDFANDNWQVLCDCGEPYQKITYDFTTSDNGAYFTPGFFGTNNQYFRVQGKGLLAQEGVNSMAVGIPLDPTWRIVAFSLTLDKPASTVTREARFRPTPRSTTGESTVSLAANSGNVICRDGLHLTPITGNKELALRMAATAGNGEVYLQKVEIIFTFGYAPTSAVPHDTDEIC